MSETFYFNYSRRCIPKLGKISLRGLQEFNACLFEVCFRMQSPTMYFHITTPVFQPVQTVYVRHFLKYSMLGG